MTRAPKLEPAEAEEAAALHLRAQREYAAQQGRRDAGAPQPGRFNDGELQTLYELAAAGL